MYDVIVSPEAEADLERTIRYLAVGLRNPQAATALADKVDSRLDDLSIMPSKHSFCKDTFLRTLGYRRASAGSYQIIYRIDEPARRVLIVHFYHTLQDYERDLLHFIDQ